MDSDFVSADRLMRALINGEFEPNLQPVVSASDFTVSGAELLVRWRMPAGEIIPPAYFINRIESAELLLPLTEKFLTVRWPDFLRLKPCCRVTSGLP